MQTKESGSVGAPSGARRTISVRLKPHLPRIFERVRINKYKMPPDHQCIILQRNSISITVSCEPITVNLKNCAVAIFT